MEGDSQGEVMAESIKDVVSSDNPSVVPTLVTNEPTQLDTTELKDDTCQPIDVHGNRIYLSFRGNTFTEVELKDFFENYGKVKRIVIKYDRKTKIPYGILTFERMESAKHISAVKNVWPNDKKVICQPYKPKENCDRLIFCSRLTPSRPLKNKPGPSSYQHDESSFYLYNGGLQPHERHQNNESHQPHERHQHNESHQPHERYQYNGGHQPHERHQNNESHQPHERQQNNESHQPYERYQYYEDHQPHGGSQYNEGYQSHGRYKYNEGHRSHGRYKNNEGYQSHGRYKYNEGHRSHGRYKNNEGYSAP